MNRNVLLTEQELNNLLNGNTNYEKVEVNGIITLRELPPPSIPYGNNHPNEGPSPLFIDDDPFNDTEVLKDLYAQLELMNKQVPSIISHIKYLHRKGEKVTPTSIKNTCGNVLNNFCLQRQQDDHVTPSKFIEMLLHKKPIVFRYAGDKVEIKGTIGYDGIDASAYLIKDHNSVYRKPIKVKVGSEPIPFKSKKAKKV